MTDEEKEAHQELYDAKRECAPMFFGRPERWYETFTVRCTNGHVSTRVLNSEQLRRDACLALLGDRQCFAPVTLTFPEDVDGSLPPVE